MALIARPGTEYEAVVQGDGNRYTISVIDDDEYSEIWVQDAFLNQRGLVYPTNLILVLGHETVPEDVSDLDRRLGEIVLGLRELTVLEEVPTVAANPFAQALTKEPLAGTLESVGVDPSTLKGIKFSLPAFHTVRRRLSGGAGEIAQRIYDAILKATRADEFDHVRFATAGPQGFRDIAAEYGPRGAQRAAGMEATRQLERGQLKGFLAQQLAAYPALQTYLLTALNRRAPDAPAMDPGDMDPRTAARIVETYGLNLRGMDTVLRALGDPDEVVWLENLNRLVQATDVGTLEDMALQVFDATLQLWEWLEDPREYDPDQVLAGKQPLLDFARTIHLGPAVGRVFEQMGQGELHQEVRQAAALLVRDAARTFTDYPEASRYGEPEVSRFGASRQRILDLADVVTDLLDADTVARLEQIRLQLEEHARQVAEERARKRRASSLGEPQYDFYWVRPDSLQPAITGGYNEIPGRVAMEQIPEVDPENLLYAALESDEVTEYAYQHVESRPSETFADDVNAIMEDARDDLEPDDWETFLERIGQVLPEDDTAFQALIDTTIERLQTDEELRRAYVAWRLPALEAKEEEESWRYEPDEESMEYQAKVTDVQEELAEEEAFEKGYVLVTWERPRNWGYDYRQPEPAEVEIRAGKSVPVEALRRLADEIIAENLITDDDPDSGSLIDSDRLSFDVESEEGAWSGSIRQYRYDRRRKIL